MRIRSLGPTESARPSHASARSRQSCGDIPPHLICGTLGRFSGLPKRQQAKSCSKVVSVGGRANSVVSMHDGWGRIVDVTTSLGTMLNAGSPSDGPSKKALEALSAIMAKDLDGTGVPVNVLVPGGITN